MTPTSINANLFSIQVSEAVAVCCCTVRAYQIQRRDTTSLPPRLESS